MSNQKLFDYFANQHGIIFIDSELHEITLQVCQSIGIESLEPAEWVEKMKSEVEQLKATKSALIDKVCQLTDLIDKHEREV